MERSPYAYGRNGTGNGTQPLTPMTPRTFTNPRGNQTISPYTATTPSCSPSTPTSYSYNNYYSSPSRSPSTPSWRSPSSSSSHSAPSTPTPSKNLTREERHLAHIKSKLWAWDRSCTSATINGSIASVLLFTLWVSWSYISLVLALLLGGAGGLISAFTLSHVRKFLQDQGQLRAEKRDIEAKERDAAKAAQPATPATPTATPVSTPVTTPVSTPTATTPTTPSGYTPSSASPYGRVANNDRIPSSPELFMRQNLHRRLARGSPSSTDYTADDKKLNEMTSVYKHNMETANMARAYQHDELTHQINSPLNRQEIRQYQPAPLNSPSRMQLRKGSEVGFVITQQADALLAAENLTDRLDDLMENMRHWLAINILHPLLAAMKEANKDGYAVTMPFNPDVGAGVTPTAMPGSSSTSTGSMWYQLSAPSTDFTSRNSNNPKIQKRMQLERYFLLPDCSSRAYLVKRIETLAEGSCVAAFNWQAGGRLDKDQDWTPELPTDTQIILHLFCTFMDDTLPKDARFLPADRPFTSQYLVVSPNDPKKNVAPVKLYQVHKYPPHLKVIYDNESWDTRQGRNHLFHALVLFIHCVQTRLDGYLGPMPLAHVANLPSILDTMSYY